MKLEWDYIKRTALLIRNSLEHFVKTDLNTVSKEILFPIYCIYLEVKHYISKDHRQLICPYSVKDIVQQESFERKEKSFNGTCIVLMYQPNLVPRGGKRRDHGNEIDINPEREFRTGKNLSVSKEK